MAEPKPPYGFTVGCATVVFASVLLLIGLAILGNVMSFATAHKEQVADAAVSRIVDLLIVSCLPAIGYLLAVIIDLLRNKH